MTGVRGVRGCRGRGGGSKKQTSANLKKWGVTGAEHRTMGLAGGNPQVSSGAESERRHGEGVSRDTRGDFLL